MSQKTVTTVFGTDAANELAAIAIDLLTAAPAKRAGDHVACALIPWSEVERGRKIMEQHGIQWKILKADTKRRRKERNQ